MLLTQRQYIFIHDAVLELIRIGNTEVPIQDLRRTYSKLQAQNPQSETSALEDDYLVSQPWTHSVSKTMNVSLSPRLEIEQAS